MNFKQIKKVGLTIGAMGAMLPISVLHAQAQTEPPKIETEQFTGDTKLACEALLCLSSGSRPSECAPSISRYFGFDDPITWMEDRINFLDMCPASNQAGMPALIRAIAMGAGRCDAEFLNEHNLVTMYKKTCHKAGFKAGECEVEEIQVVSKDKPQFCAVYENNQYTDINVKYIGDPEKGGLWAEGADYNAKLAEYEQKRLNDQASNSPFKSVTYSYEKATGDSKSPFAGIKNITGDR